LDDDVWSRTMGGWPSAMREFIVLYFKGYVRENIFRCFRF